jgi:glyoxylase-like metal-dependent hydrolase (beta-lactamase superfamily II)
MVRSGWVLTVSLLLSSGLSVAQQLPRGYVDPMPVLRAASEAIGAGKLNCITISGSGYSGKVGQNVTQETDWPRGEPLMNYTRTINFDAKTSIETFTRKPGLNPRSWKYGVGWLGGTPLQQNERQTFVVSGNYAWHMDGEGGEPIPAPAMADLWQLDLWLNAPGFLKAAMLPGANPKAVWRWELVESGRDGATTGEIEKVTVVSATLLGKYRVNATINSKNLIQRLETKVPFPVLGDLNYEHEHTAWKKIGDVSFPTGWHHHEGYDDERYKPTLSGGHNAFGGTFDNIRVNDCGTPVTIPDAVRQARVPPLRVETQKLAEGVWLLGGTTHNSVVVEFKDFVAVVEAPLDEERSLAVIEEIVKLAPNKPIRFVVNTHDHYDHAGGLRTYLHIGSTIITHRRNQPFYEAEVFNYVPWTVQPDLVTLFEPTEVREGYTTEFVAENYVVSDGARNMHISYVQPLAHVEGMLMAYLPGEKIVIEADLFDLPARGAAPTSTDASHRTFYNHVKRLGLDVSTVAPIHGPAVPWSDFLKVAGEAK